MMSPTSHTLNNALLQVPSWENLATIVNDVDETLLDSPSQSAMSMQRVPSQMLLSAIPPSGRSEQNLVAKLNEMENMQSWSPATSPVLKPDSDTPPAAFFGLDSSFVPPSWQEFLSPNMDAPCPNEAVVAAVCSASGTSGSVTSSSSREQELFDPLATTQLHLSAVDRIVSRARSTKQRAQPIQAPSLSCFRPPRVIETLAEYSVQHPVPTTFPPPAPSSPTDGPKPKKRKARHFGGDVVPGEGEAAGAPSEGGGVVLQCRGTNRKKRTRCRNAALMEYVGPRPLYCAEHIGLDPEALYHKCAFPLIPDSPKAQPKRCKEIVFREFKHCYKHFVDWLRAEYPSEASIEDVQRLLTTASTLSSQLEDEAARAKLEDPELYQRKSKLMPKYQSMVRCLESHLAFISGSP